MEKDSISRLGVNPELFDDNSYEMVSPDTHNSIIVLHMRKELNASCPYCASTNIASKGTKVNSFYHATICERKIQIKLYRHSYKCCTCDHYFLQSNPFKSQGRKNSHCADLAIPIQ